MNLKWGERGEERSCIHINEEYRLWKDMRTACQKIFLDRGPYLRKIFKLHGKIVILEGGFCLRGSLAS